MRSMIAGSMIAAAVMAATAPASAAEAPYLGTWDCTGYGTLTITADSYDFGDRAEIESVERDGPAYVITTTDGYTVSVAVSGRTLNWFSPESGDSFDCKRKK